MTSKDSDQPLRSLSFKWSASPTKFDVVSNGGFIADFPVGGPRTDFRPNQLYLNGCR